MNDFDQFKRQFGKMDLNVLQREMDLYLYVRSPALQHTDQERKEMFQWMVEEKGYKPRPQPYWIPNANYALTLDYALSVGIRPCETFLHLAEKGYLLGIKILLKHGTHPSDIFRIRQDCDHSCYKYMRWYQKLLVMLHTESYFGRLLTQFIL